MIKTKFVDDSQVVNGGELDIDVTFIGPGQDVIYKEQRREYDTIQFNTTVSGYGFYEKIQTTTSNQQTIR